MICGDYMRLDYQRKLAAKILKVGQDRVWFDPEHLEEIKNALTRESIRILINKGYIAKKQKKGVSRVRANYIAEQKKKGRRKGPGSRRGKKTARMPKKESWMNRIRAVRRLLREFKEKGIITRSEYRMLYGQASAGRIRSKAYLKLLISKMKSRKVEE